MTNRGVLVAAGTLVAANLLILGGVMRNRAGNPDAVVRLSERELVSWGDQSLGAEPFLNLRVQWTMATRPDGGPWFDRAKLESLGNTALPAADDTAAHRQWRRGSRPGYAVLELAGPAWERWLTTKQARSDSAMAFDTVTNPGHVHGGASRAVGERATRLMAVDFGLDPAALRQQYPERSQYLILPATYQMGITPARRDSLGNLTARAQVEGDIGQLLPGTVHVPRPLRDSLLGLGAAMRDSTTRFELTLKVGKQWEVWVE